ncbi:hypothetical protein F5148DRAFT_1198381 [Russula earlei]|uniref:Uncharacterized protein n=1 Tax=Russula earlei TaxID=71964 RepID=A0ACC0U931_9AGAM|nr:hypothetical protein F5148DRAFT_1198381 [Russula earlei]
MTVLDGVNGTVCNMQQYQQSLLSLTSPSPDPSISCLTHGQSIGLALTAEASLISLVCVVIIFILIVRNIIRHRKAFPNGDWKLLRVPPDIYMLSLFIFDVVHATGGILNIRWAGKGIVTTGQYCLAQGIMKQIGELGTALITLILAAHTFISALWHVGFEARRFAFAIVGLTCVFIALWVGIPNGAHKNYEAPSPYWCWISPQFNAERLAGEYVWLWVALFASMTMYIPLYLWAEGRLSIGERWYKFRLSNPDEKVEYTKRKAALGMLFYPLAYSLVVLPLSAARWSLFKHKDVPSAAMFFGLTMFNLSGAINVLLFLVIRPQLLLFAPLEPSVEPEAQPYHLDMGAVMSFETAKHENDLEPAGIEAADDLGKRLWNFAFQGSRNSASPSDEI